MGAILNSSKEIKLECIEADRQCKKIADEYKKSSRLLRQCIDKIKVELYTLEPKNPARIELIERRKILNSMLRTTSDIGREAGHYYEKGWWRSEVYTINAR